MLRGALLDLLDLLDLLATDGERRPTAAVHGHLAFLRSGHGGG
ncbi:hypothetical protein [Streptomyces abyssomicinicus]|nr:hypothetical protein [Streptomyces abyssomicinicus]